MPEKTRERVARERVSGKRASFQDQAPQKLIYDEMELVAVRKVFLSEHPFVSNRSEAECDEIRMRNGIHIVYSAGKVEKQWSASRSSLSQPGL